METSLIANLLACGASGTKGSGLDHCPFDLNDMSSSGALLLLNKGEKLPSQFIKSEFDKLIQKEKLTILKGIFSVEDNSGDNQREAGSGQKESLASEGLPKMTFSFDNGRYFDGVLRSLQSKGRYDIILSDGYNADFRDYKDGTYGGYTAGQIERLPYVRTVGGTTAKSRISVQLTNAQQYASDFAYISGDSLSDWTLDDLSGVNDLNLSFTSVPVNGSTNVEIKVVGAADSHAIEELEETDFRVRVNGVVVTATLGTPSGEDGIYNFTIPAISTGDKISIGTYDTAENCRAIINAAGVIYKSNEAELVAIA